MAVQVYSDDRSMRYWHEEETGQTGGRVCFVLLNPTPMVHAGGNATIAACRRFARAWGKRRLVIVNLSPRIECDPASLPSHVDPAAIKENETHIRKAIDEADQVVVAWGAHPAARVLVPRFIAAIGDMYLHCIRLTKDGHPAHPCRHPTTQAPIPFSVIP